MNLPSPVAPAPRRSTLLAAASLTAALAALVAIAGPLNPPAGPVTSTNKTLAEVEPRTAINTTNTPGDPGSLFRITQPGSYYLTGNITGIASKHGIAIAANGVTIDLMGFDLIGITGSLDGVSTTVTGLDNLTIKGGSIRNWGGDGVDPATFPSTGTAAIDLHSSGNAGVGIAAGNICIIRGCTAAANGLSGIVGGSSAVISNCTADGNGGSSTGLSEGIFAGDGSAISGCTSQNNASLLIGGVGDRGMGFRTANRCTITDCTASRNLGHGFRLLTNSRISGCLSTDNGSGSTVSAGIYAAGADNQVDSNQTNTSDIGIQAIVGGNIITRNVASGNGANFNLVADNIYGPIIDRRIPTSVPSTPAVNGFTAASTLGSTDPAANFSY